MPEQVNIIAVEVEDPFTLGTVMTETLQAALPAVVSRVRSSLHQFRPPEPILAS
jgi:hypothetical protein